MRARTFCHEPVNSCGSGAWFCAAIWTKYQRLEVGIRRGCANITYCCRCACGIVLVQDNILNATARAASRGTQLGRTLTIVATVGGIIEGVALLAIVFARRSLLGLLAHLLLAVALEVDLVHGLGVVAQVLRGGQGLRQSEACLDGNTCS